VSAIYSASKSAFERWSETLATEIAPFSLGVTVLIPGTFDTEIITGRSPDYGDYDGPYLPHYTAMRKAADTMIKKAASPRIFARALARATEDTAPFVRRAVGIDAIVMSMIARVLPARTFHGVLGQVLWLPGKGALRGYGGYRKLKKRITREDRDDLTTNADWGSS
jgi:short-subunit dehydrogenase